MVIAIFRNKGPGSKFLWALWAPDCFDQIIFQFVVWRAAMVTAYSLIANDVPVGELPLYSMRVIEAANGQFWVLSAEVTDGSTTNGLYAQLIDSSGNRLGQLIKLTSLGTDADLSMYGMDAASLVSGGFVVVSVHPELDGLDTQLYAQLFDDNGDPLGGEFAVGGPSLAIRPSVSALNDGGFVVAWSRSGEVFLQRFDSEGVAQPLQSSSGTSSTLESQANSFTAGSQTAPQVQGLANGGFLVVWESFAQDGSGWGIYGQLLDASGNRWGQEFLINVTTTGHQQEASIASLDDGGFVVVWKSNGSDAYGQLYNSAGLPSGSEFSIGSTLDFQLISSISVSAESDGFTVLLNGRLVGGSENKAFIERFDFTGDAVTNAIQVSIGSEDGGVVAGSNGDRILLVTHDGSAVRGDVYGPAKFIYPVGNPDDPVTPEQDSDDWHTAQDLGTQLEAGVAKFHLGEDWNKAGGDSGEDVMPIFGGTVVYAQDNGDNRFGNTVVIQHILPDGSVVYSLYAHLQDICISEGSWVTQETVLGTIGQTGATAADHLHFEILSYADEHVDSNGNAPDASAALGYLVASLPTGAAWGYATNPAAHFGSVNQGVTHAYSYTEGLYTWYNPSMFIDRHASLNSGAGQTTIDASEPSGTYIGTSQEDSVHLIPSALGPSVITIGKSASDVLVNLASEAKTFVLKSIEELEVFLGASNDDITIGDLSGTSISQNTIYIHAGEGNDTVNAVLTDRRIVAEGGSGEDILLGGAGNDWLSGEQGNDTLTGGAGDDVLIGGAGDDALQCGSNGGTFDATTVSGWDGEAGSAQIDIGVAADAARISDIAFGGSETDALDMQSLLTGSPRTVYTNPTSTFGNFLVGVEIIMAGTAADIINLTFHDGVTRTAYAENVSIFAGAGEDTVFSGSGNDLIVGGRQNGIVAGEAGDFLYGGQGNDTIFGDDENFAVEFGGADRLFGGQGADTVHGGAAGDTIYGGSEIDSLFGSTGDDIIFDFDGADMSGEAGADLLVLQVQLGGTYTVTGGKDEIETDGADRIFVSGNYNVVNSSLGAFDDLYIGGITDSGSAQIDRVEGGGGNDIISSWYGTDEILGGEGNDALWGGAGGDTLIGGPGTDYIYGGEGNNDQLFGGGGTDYYYWARIDGTGDQIFDEFRGTAGPGQADNVLSVFAGYDANSELPPGTGVFEIDGTITDSVDGDDMVIVSPIDDGDPNTELWRLEINQGLGVDNYIEFDARDVHQILLWNHDATAGTPTIQTYEWNGSTYMMI